jgi:pimeloyl-ACP methyl ester carboxylesterase
MVMPESQTGTFDVSSGGKLYYEVAGQGHPLLLAHAGVADLRMWDDQFAVFAESYRVIRYDMRGYGKSELGTGTFLHRQDLNVLLDHLQVERAYLIGCSHGGEVVIDYTLEHPERVAALIPVDAALSGFQMQGQPPPQILEMMPAFERGDLERVAELQCQLFIDGPKRTPEQSNQSVRGKLREMTLIGLRSAAFLHGDQPPLDPPATQRLGEIHVPTLVIAGDYDNPEILRIADTIVAGVPGAQKVIIHAAAHLPNMEKPAEFNRAVLEFLGRLD